jgi:hypothetical protein
MPTFEYDLRYLKAGLDQLEAYLLTADIYWPLGIGAARGEPQYPPLTLGMLLLALRRAQAMASTPAQQEEWYHLSSKMEVLRNRWRTAWGKKASAEFHARLILWRDFMEEYCKEPEKEVDRYAYEVTRRVLLQMLIGEAIDLPPAQLKLLNGLDRMLKATFTPGKFVWEEELVSTFTPETFWFLYGRLHTPT